MLVSPAEPKDLWDLGTISPKPEKLGMDFLLMSHGLGPVGVQRKELSDLVSSVHDGRLAKEMAQGAALGVKVLLVEGRARWTRDGNLMSPYGTWTRSQHDGVLWSAQLHGWWTANTETMSETREWLGRFQRWCLKKTHNGVVSRPGAKTGMWGTRGSKEWAVHLLMGFESLGVERAEGIVEMFGGPPLAWTVGADDLEQVDGIGPVTARKLIEALDGDKS